VSQVLEQLEFSVGSLGQHWSAEWLHDLLDGNGLASQLIFGGTIMLSFVLRDF
jgi:hypothetical protein